MRVSFQPYCFDKNPLLFLLKQYGWKDTRIKNVLEEKVFQTLEKGNSRRIKHRIFFRMVGKHGP